MAPVPTGPSASRAPPTGPKARATAPVGPGGAPGAVRPVPVSFGGYGYGPGHAGRSGSGRGRGRPFARANGHGHGHGHAGMGQGPPPVPMAGQGYPSGPKGYSNGYGQYPPYGYPGSYDPSMMAGPSTAPYTPPLPPPPTAPAPARKLNAPKPPSRPPTPPPPPPPESPETLLPKRERSPVKISLPQIPIKSPSKAKETKLRVERKDEIRVEADFLPVVEPARSPISITFNASVKARSKPSHLDLENLPSTLSASSLSQSAGRPPTPDLPPPPPPPPPADVPPPPAPTSPTIAVSPRVIKKPPTSPRPAPPRLPPPPPPVIDAPPPPPRPPTSPKPRIPSLARPVPQKASKWDVAPPEPVANGHPPAFHFREMPAVPDPAPSEESSDESESEEEEAGASWSREMPPHRQLPPHMAIPPPLPPPKEPTPPPPPPVEPEWEPPSWFFPRQVGSYVITLDKDGRKEVSRRVDGLVDGKPIEAVDPRRGAEGRGTGKLQTSFRPVTYTWGPLSVGPRPPEPATAILITGLSPLTTADQVRTFLRPHGRIRELDAKMDSKSGMQLGICWVKFDGPAGSAPGDRGRKGGMTAHDVAVAVVKACNGHRVGMTSTERVTVVLDGEGKKTIKAVKEEMERRYPKPKPAAVVPLPKPPTPMAPPIGTPTSGAATPRPNGKLPVPVAIKLHAQVKGLPRNPMTHSVPVMPKPYAPRFPVNLPIRPVGLPAKPATQSFTASFVDAPFEDRGRKVDTYLPSRSSSFSRSPSRSRFRSASSDYTSDSESDASYGRHRSRSPRRMHKSPIIPRKVLKGDDERTRSELEKNGRPAIWIDKDVLPTTQQNEVHLWDHFRNFRPENILRAPTGFYILFGDHASAERAKFLDGSSMHGKKVALIVKTGHVKVPLEAKTPQAATFGKKKIPLKPVKSPKVSKQEKRRVVYTSSEESEGAAPAKRVKPVVVSRAPATPPAPVALPPAPQPAESIPEPFREGESEVDEAPKGKKRPAVSAKGKKGKKPRIISPAPLIPATDVEEPPVAEIKLDAPVPPAAAPKPKPKPKAKLGRPRKTALSPLERFISDDQVVDEEDAYWLSRALAMPEGMEVEEDDAEMDPLLPDDHPLHHTSGSWRVEGLRKVPPALKSAYLPQRNRAQAVAEEASAVGGGLTTGRTARASGRRLALDMETHRKTLVTGPAAAATAAAATAENDIFAFNQLRIRKKQLRFARSAIEGYGLYAMETIQPNEMVCEYVGELVRSSVADLREAKYLKQGIGSSYLFRIDADVVCDATFRGSVSRLINHSCDPSANAKIISINGQSKIVIYAKRLLSPGEEILYDYKFPLESDPALRVPCLCGSKICRGFLN